MLRNENKVTKNYKENKIFVKIFVYLYYICCERNKINYMSDIKTANTPKHNYGRNIKKYIKTQSTKSLRAILRQKRLDAGFFFLEFYPLVRDIFIERHKFLTEQDFEILLQLHANQPFSVDDIDACLIRKSSYKHPVDWGKRASMGYRARVRYMKMCDANGVIRVFKMNGRANKKLYEFTPKFNSEFREIYENMLCLTKVRSADRTKVPEPLRKSIVHYKKMNKQNIYKDGLDADAEIEIKTSDNEFGIKLRDARRKSRM